MKLRMDVIDQRGAAATPVDSKQDDLDFFNRILAAFSKSQQQASSQYNGVQSITAGSLHAGDASWILEKKTPVAEFAHPNAPEWGTTAWINQTIASMSRVADAEKRSGHVSGTFL